MRAHLAAGLLGVLQAGAALACGHCVEDKIAAVYNHARVIDAQARKQQVAFLAIEGPLVINEQSRRALVELLRTQEGVVPGSVQVSLELASLSFVFDPGRTRFDALFKSINKKMQRTGLRVVEMKLL